MELDEIDLEILKELDRRGEVDAEALGEELGISPSTVYYRIENYRESGVLAGRIADLDPKELGFELTAITEIKSDYGAGYGGVGESLADLAGTQEVFQMLGEMSFLVIARVRDHDHLQQHINRIIDMDGVVDSSTHIVLETVKRDSRLLVNYDDEDLDALVD